MAQIALSNAHAKAQTLALQVEKMKFQIAQLRHERYGNRPNARLARTTRT